MYNNINTFTVYYIWSQGKLLHVHLAIEAHYTGDKIYAHKHGGSWYMRISHTLLASKVKQVLLVVNSIKLHLTALTHDSFDSLILYTHWKPKS